MTVDEILAQIRAFAVPLVEITGGEPLVQKGVFPLIKKLCDENFEVLIETGGYVSTEGTDERAKIILDVKCPASGEAERNYWANLDRIRADKDEVKFVVADREDLQFARQVVEKYNLEQCAKAILISPVWNEMDLIETANWVAASNLKNARMQLQLHKYIWGADVHGV